MEVREILRDIPFKAAYVSTSERCRDTCAIIVKGRNIPVYERKGLKEVNFGTWEAAEIDKNLEEINRRRSNGIHWDDCGGDSDESFAERVKDTYHRIYDDCSDGDQILIVSHVKKLIRAASKLGVNMITTFIGRDQTKTIEENLELVKEIWPPIISLAEEKGVKIAIENCPMLFGPDQWPGGQNLMTTPAIWRKIFEILPSKFLGINYDPSHFVWQMIDYIQPIYEFKDKIFHIHYKDIKIYPDCLRQVGIMGYPLEFMSPKLPGLGDVDWGKYVSALTDIDYHGLIFCGAETWRINEITTVRALVGELTRYCE